MRRHLPLLLLPLLAACADGLAGGPSYPGLFGGEPEVPEGPPPLPPAVAAALPPGTPSTVVFQNADGCYLYSIERTDPPSGYPVRDALGTPICEGGPAPVLVAGAGPLPPASPVAPVPAEPAAGPIDITPVLEAPRPPGAGAGAPVAGTDPDTDAALTPFAPGSITPPAPIVAID